MRLLTMISASGIFALSLFHAGLASSQNVEVVSDELEFKRSTYQQQKWIRNQISDGLLEQGITSTKAEACMKTVQFSLNPNSGIMDINEKGGVKFSATFLLQIWGDTAKKSKARGEVYDPKSAFFKISKHGCQMALRDAMKLAHDDVVAYLRVKS